MSSDWEKVAGQMAVAGLPSLGTLLGGLAGTALMPGVGSALGGSLGGAVGKAAAAAVGAALGVPPTPEAIAEKVAADPDGARIALARIDADARMRLAELQDVASARSMLVSLEQEHAASGKAPAILSIVGVVGFFAIVAVLMLMRTDPPTALAHLMDTVLGAVIVIFKQIYDFWLGSSRSSQRKDAQIGAMLSAARQ
ncbi:hypothetical protein [Methylobacterium organophilum]|uniref:Uncharacterized protein n=1 Tax=Methylobacterium organophilum TaxID=410 RepID=A0ABQ4T8F2_METOR|nr:hypothetical protein [Methylobacterium organophilum]GJE27931.1 hypothetical protein LKMONMHP_2793 [Methylobacterium organophilum]